MAWAQDSTWLQPHPRRRLIIILIFILLFRSLRNRSWTPAIKAVKDEPTPVSRCRRIVHRFRQPGPYFSFYSSEAGSVGTKFHNAMKVAAHRWVRYLLDEIWITRDNEPVTASSSVFTVYESRHSKHNLIKQDTTYAEDEFLSVIHGCSALRIQRMAGRAFTVSEKCQRPLKMSRLQRCVLE